eukprot:2398397-Pleurochrysis_carterae.AAC.1
MVTKKRACASENCNAARGRQLRQEEEEEGGLKCVCAWVCPVNTAGAAASGLLGRSAGSASSILLLSPNGCHYSNVGLKA